MQAGYCALSDPLTAVLIVQLGNCWREFFHREMRAYENIFNLTLHKVTRLSKDDHIVFTHRRVKSHPFGCLVWYRQRHKDRELLKQVTLLKQFIIHQVVPRIGMRHGIARGSQVLLVEIA
jgi:hypothetical protein